MRDAADLHADALVWDMTMPIITTGSPEKKAGVFGNFRRGGFDFVSITLAVDFLDSDLARQSLELHRGFIAGNDDVVLVRSVEEILAAKSQGRLAVGLHFQGTGPFDEDASLVGRFYEFGIRHALLAYNQRNRVGCGCQVPEDTGLTDFGRSVIAEMNRVGMIVDCAHTGLRTSMEAIACSQSPVIVSHGNARALRDHPRCITDELIRAIAASGGVIGITGIGEFLGTDGASPAAVADHIDYIAGLAGPEHVGLGLDHVYDIETFGTFVREHPEMYPAESQSFDESQVLPQDAPAITAELLERGYGEQEIRGILGENWLRVCRAVWK